MSGQPPPAPGAVEEVSAASLARAAKEIALAHGFDLAAVAPPEVGGAYDRSREWIGRGYAGEMGYLSRNGEKRSDLRRVWPDTRAALVVAVRSRPPGDSTGPALAAAPGAAPAAARKVSP